MNEVAEARESFSSLLKDFAIASAGLRDKQQKLDEATNNVTKAQRDVASSGQRLLEWVTHTNYNSKSEVYGLDGGVVYKITLEPTQSIELVEVIR